MMSDEDIQSESGRAEYLLSQFKRQLALVEDRDAEIERLQEQIIQQSESLAANEKAFGQPEARLEEPDRAINQLCDDNVTLTDANIDLEQQLDRAIAHVGELEIEASESHHITDEQIDAAWSDIEAWDGEASRAIESALNKFNIFRCEDCNGRGHLDQEPQTSGAYPNLQPPCPACTGHGWTIGGEDDLP